MTISVTRRLTLSPPTIFVENLYKILKILEEFICFVNFRCVTNILTQLTSRKAILKELGRRIKNGDGKGIFKNFDTFENV